MNNEVLIKAAILFGGGFLIFMLVKPKSPLSVSSSAGGSKSFDDNAVAPTKGNAEIVMTAYTSALDAGETPAKLSELNKECLKEFGMTCSVDNGQAIVKDAKGEVVLTK